MVHTLILPTKTLQFANLQPSKPNNQRHHVDIHSSPCNLCKHLHLLLFIRESKLFLQLHCWDGSLNPALAYCLRIVTKEDLFTLWP